MELGKRIAEIRKEHNLTQEDLAEICSVTRQTISNWENGKSYPDLETLVLISDTYGVSLDAMMKGDRKMVSKITKEQKQGRSNAVKIIIGVIIVIAIVFGGICYDETHESYISYDKSGITVSEKGELFTDKNYKRYVSYRFVTETVNEENHEVVFIYLTGNISTNYFNQKHDSKTPFVGYGESNGQSLGDNGEMLNNVVTEVYYLSDIYVGDQGLHNSKHSTLVPLDASEQEMKEIVQKMKSDSILIWERKEN